MSDAILCDENHRGLITSTRWSWRSWCWFLLSWGCFVGLRSSFGLPSLPLSLKPPPRTTKKQYQRHQYHRYTCCNVSHRCTIISNLRVHIIIDLNPINKLTTDCKNLCKRHGHLKFSPRLSTKNGDGNSPESTTISSLLVCVCA